MATSLYSKVDGWGLQAHHGSPNVSNWITDNSVSQTGRNYVGAVGVRAASLYTAGRSSRGTTSSPMCEACGQFDSLGHRMQVCAKTWGMRIARHNYVASKLKGLLERHNYTVFQEQTIKTSAGLRRPDIVAVRAGRAHVIDVTVVSDNAALDLEHGRKVNYYHTPEIVEFVANLTRTDELAVSISALVFNWRGAISSRSYGDMITMGITSRECELLSVVALERGHQIHSFLTKSTWRHTERLRTAGDGRRRFNQVQTNMKSASLTNVT